MARTRERERNRRRYEALNIPVATHRMTDVKDALGINDVIGKLILGNTGLVLREIFER